MGLGLEDYRLFLQRILEELEKAFSEEVIISVALFGSVARGEAYPDSDIDLLIVHKEIPYDTIKRFADSQFEIEKGEEYKKLRRRGFYPEVSPIFMDLQKLSVRPLILLDIMDHGVILRDKGGFLLDKISKLKERLKDLGSQKVLLKDGSWAWDLKPDWKPGEIIEIVL